MIGTNNLGINPDEEIVEGLQFLIHAIKARQPQVKLIMSGILPRKKMEEQVKNINEKIKTMSLKNHVEYVDFGKDFLKGNQINSELFVGDGLHPNAYGYGVLGKDLMRVLRK